MPSLSKRKFSNRQKVLAVFEYPGLYDLASVFPAQRRVATNGRQSGYPDLLMFGLTVCSRVYKTQRKMHTEMSDGTVWAEVVDAYRAGAGVGMVDVPAIPPSEDQIDRFLVRIAGDLKACDDAEKLFTDSSIGLARYLGNFGDSRGSDRDLSKPDPRHTVTGDGAYADKFSEVTEYWCEKTQTMVPLGSRAKDPANARIQRKFTNPAEDGKQDTDARGVNHVTLSTWTDYGWVILGTGQALGAEITTALSLIDRVYGLLKDELHTVVWDRALSGWVHHHLLTERSINLVGKPVARNNHQRQPDGRGGWVSPQRTITEAEAIAMVEAGKHLPLGTSLYALTGRDQTKKQWEMSNSVYARLPRHHQLTCPAQHDLWVDGGAVYDVRRNARGWLVKTDRLGVLSAHRVRSDKGQWAVDYRFKLPCGIQRKGHHVVSVRALLAEGRTGRQHAKTPLAYRELRPIPRADAETFRDEHGIRNMSESFNEWFKQTLGNHKRAAHLDVTKQRLDHLGAGLLANAITLQKFVEESD